MNLIRYHFPELHPWAPFDRLASVRSEINRLFAAGTSTQESTRTPALDLYDEKERFVVRVELPGRNKDGINITLHEGVLTISGERKHQEPSNERESSRNERSFGKFRRSVTLPAVIEAANIKATYKDGVLVVELPKAEEAKPKQIQVNIS